MKTSISRRSRQRIRIAIDLLTSAAILLAVGVVIWRSWPASPPPIPVPADPVTLDGAVVRGNPAASTVMIEYADFQCPYCGAFDRETMPEFNRRYVAAGKVRFAYRHMIGPSHDRALPAAIAAECAGRQGKFWEMHDLLFANQAKLDDKSLADHRQTLGLDAATFKACQADATVAGRVTNDTTRAREIKIGGTPTFFIGVAQADGRVKVRRALRGAVPFADLQTAIDAELAGAPPGTLVWLRPTVVILLAAALGMALVFAARRRRVRRLSQADQLAFFKGVSASS